MAVMNVRSAIIAESTLSFMGLGLPIEVVTWGSMLSLAEKALMTDAWWILLIPGAFLVVTLLCITNLGDYLRSRTSRKRKQPVNSKKKAQPLGCAFFLFMEFTAHSGCA